MTALLALAIAIGFVLFVCVVIPYGSSFLGWWWLAKAYPAPQGSKPAFETQAVHFACNGTSSYGVWIGTDRAALYLRQTQLLTFGSPFRPIRIPFSDISVCEYNWVVRKYLGFDIHGSKESFSFWVVGPNVRDLIANRTPLAIRSVL